MRSSHLKRVFDVLTELIFVVILISTTPPAAHAQDPESLPQWVKRLQAASQQNEVLRQSVESGELGTPLVIELSVIGASQKNVPMYLVKISSPGAATDNPKRVFVVAGQHGDEPAGPAGMLSLVEQLAESTDPDIEKLFRWTELYIVPVANPDGFAVGHRLMWNHRNLNRDWHVRRTPEARAIWAWIIQLKPVVLFDLHENTPRDREGAYIVITRPAKGIASPAVISQSLRKHGCRIPVKARSGCGGLLHTEFSRAFKRTGCLVETKFLRNPEIGIDARGSVHQVSVMSVVGAISLREREISAKAGVGGNGSVNHENTTGKR